MPFQWTAQTMSIGIKVILGLVALISTVRGTEYHVALSGDDQNPGTPSAPMRTIQRAADLAQPGDVITVHQGVYRERISPPRGGVSDARRIVYQAAPGEQVTIKGSEVVTNWVKVQAQLWKVTLPNAFFGNFNPYADLIHGDWFNSKGRPHHTGAVYLNGDWLVEAARREDVFAPPGTVPLAFGSNAGGYLMNVAWLQFGQSANGSARIPAARFASQHGTQTAPCSEGGQCLGWIENGDWVRYENVDFGAHTDTVEIRAAAPGNGGIIELHLDSPGGLLLGVCSVSNTGDWQSWASFPATIKPMSGVANLCLRFCPPAPPANPPLLWFGEVGSADTTIWAQFMGVNPNEQCVEINVRQTVFYPRKSGINYLTVRGFTLRDAATPWAPPTAEQIGVLGTHWSKGWLIESNVVSHSTCSGIALGKYGDAWDNTSADTAEGYVKTIERALTNGWSGENIGHHIVRDNTISDCEQTGIVGSLGAVFSTIAGNDIHDIHVRQLFTGAEMAGIKLHAAIDVVINHNHIHRNCRGIWLDWMAQGARVSGNLLHGNAAEDLFVEVDHGPFLVDNNLFLSPTTLLSHSQGGAYVHNLMTGGISVNHYDDRQTPFHKAHSTAVAGMRDNPRGDDRYYNNLLVARADLSQYDESQLPVAMAGNVFLKGAKPSRHEARPLVRPEFDPEIKLVPRSDSCQLQLRLDPVWSTEETRKLVTTALLGRAVIPNLPFENADGTPLRVDTDYFGKPRNEGNPTPGPFENPGAGRQTLKVW